MFVRNPGVPHHARRWRASVLGAALALFFMALSLRPPQPAARSTSAVWGRVGLLGAAATLSARSRCLSPCTDRHAHCGRMATHGRCGELCIRHGRFSHRVGGGPAAGCGWPPRLGRRGRPARSVGVATRHQPPPSTHNWGCAFFGLEPCVLLALVPARLRRSGVPLVRRDMLLEDTSPWSRLGAYGP